MECEGGGGGLWGAEPALMDAGESPNAENADGRSALMLAAAAGDLSVVETLIMAGALLDAQDHYGMTALMNAVVMHRLEITRLLLNAGADPNARETGGRSALMFAAATDHAEIVECLVVGGTELDATCGPRSRTALMIAAEGAREKALRVLLAHGADPSIRDIDGKTAAHLARTKRMVRLLRKYDRTKERASFLGGLFRGRLLHSNSGSKSARRLGTGSCRSLELEPAASEIALGIELHDVQSLCSAMHESQFPFDRIYERLADVSARLHSTAHVMRKSDDVNEKYLQALSDLYELLTAFSSKHAITRLLGSRTIMKSCFDLHTQLDELEEKLLSANHFEAKSSWQQQWKIDCETHAALLMDFITQTYTLEDSSTDDEVARLEALTLLSFECERRRTKYSTQQLYLMHKYAQSMTRRFHTLVVSVPHWFIPAYDVEFAHGAARSNHERLGIWADKPGLVKTLAKHDDQKQFAKDIEAWMLLQHPHILQLYGACHVGEHPFVVLEAASTRSLAEYLCRQRLDAKPQFDLQHFQLLWQKLHQVALAIEYLHERKIAHGQLHRSRSVTVDASGSVKLHMGFDNVHLEGSAFRARASSTSSRRLLDAGDALASDIYMLGRLILNALTLSDRPRELDLRDGETLPKRPASMTNAHWSLVECMCATNASQRCTISTALQQIQQFADL